MKDKKLKRLNRGELLELLLTQTQEVDRLQEQLRQVEAELTERNLKVEIAGDLAHAVLAVNNVVGAAQLAAQQYLDNIAAMEAAAKEKCEQLIRDAMAEAELIRRNAETAAQRKKSDELPPVQELFEQDIK